MTLNLIAVSRETSTVTVRGHIENHVRPVQQQKLQAGSTLTVFTDARGHYTFSQLKPGGYRLQAAPAGFQPFSETIVLGPGKLHVENVKLRLASVVQTVVAL